MLASIDPVLMIYDIYHVEYMSLAHSCRIERRTVAVPCGITHLTFVIYGYMSGFIQLLYDLVQLQCRQYEDNIARDPDRNCKVQHVLYIITQ